MKTLVGYDGSDPAKRALSIAAELATRSGDVDVGVVNVLATSPPPSTADESEQEQLLLEARKLIGEAGRSASTLRRRGSVARELIDAANEINANLLNSMPEAGADPVPVPREVAGGRLSTSRPVEEFPTWTKTFTKPWFGICAALGKESRTLSAASP